QGATEMMKGEIRLITSEEDRISWLPDCLLVEIISRLPETKYAIRTDAVVVRWENLRTLRIDDAEIDHDSSRNILSGSPLLETLMLGNCCGFELLDITNKSVNNLVFSGYDAIYMHSVEINAPYILSLTIEAYLPLEKLLLRNVSSVIKAELDYYKTVIDDISLETLDEVNDEMLKGLLFSLGHAKEVKIGKLCLEALAGLKAEGFICPSNLKEVDN
nr:hypothetical protein [Tanacetum cinerariifolium]